MLRHFEERRNPEIAAILGVSVEAVESLLARGRRELAARLRRGGRNWGLAMVERGRDDANDRDEAALAPFFAAARADGPGRAALLSAILADAAEVAPPGAARRAARGRSPGGAPAAPRSSAAGAVPAALAACAVARLLGRLGGTVDDGRLGRPATVRPRRATIRSGLLRPRLGGGADAITERRRTG